LYRFVSTGRKEITCINNYVIYH